MHDPFRPHIDLEKQELRNGVLSAIGRLGRTQRETTILFYIEGYTIDEMAAIQDVTAGTIKRRLYDAWAKLKEDMIDMVEEVLKDNAPKEDFSKRVFDLLNAYTFANKTLSLSEMSRSIAPFILVALALFTGLFAGSYPAFYLSTFRPVAVLKDIHQRTASGALLRKGLVIFQFSISAMFIIGTMIAYEQLSFIRNKKLEFDKGLIVTAPLFFSNAV